MLVSFLALQLFHGEGERERVSELFARVIAVVDAYALCTFFVVLRVGLWCVIGL